MPKNTASEKRPVGRPSSFPGLKPEQICNMPLRIPTATRVQIRQLAANRGMTIGAFVALLTEQAWGRSSLGKKKSG